MFGFFGGFVLGFLVAAALVGYFFWKARKGMALIGVAKNAIQAADYIMKDDEIYTAYVPKGKTPDENYCVGYQNHFPEAKVLNFLPLDEALNIYTDNDYPPLMA